MAHILLIDDDTAGREMAAYNLRKGGHTVDEASDGHTGLSNYRPGSHDLVITDVRMPEMSGIDVTREVHERDKDVPVLVITAFGSIETAVDAMKAGADDFLLKPFSRDQLLMVIDKVLAHRRLESENRELRRKLAGIERPIIYESKLMAEAVSMAETVAQSDASVLVAGESGTGKELIARRIHARGKRYEKPFVAVNCAAIPADLIETELFGHEKGAFTGALRNRLGRFREADGGTLFLDEVAELPVELQSKLLRVLQENAVDSIGADQPVPVNVRVISASNRDLREEIASQSFREDLYYRLNVIEISVPPLRRRAEDIPPLVEHFVAEFAAGRQIHVPDEVMSALQRREWPGNVRELRNACERMVVLCLGDTVTVDLLPVEAGTTEAKASAELTDGWPDLPADGFSLLDLEKRVIERVLAIKNGNISESARYLRVPRHILVYRIEKHGIARSGR